MHDRLRAEHVERHAREQREERWDKTRRIHKGQSLSTGSSPNIRQKDHRPRWYKTWWRDLKNSLGFFWLALQENWQGELGSFIMAVISVALILFAIAECQIRQGTPPSSPVFEHKSNLPDYDPEPERWTEPTPIPGNE